MSQESAPQDYAPLPHAAAEYDTAMGSRFQYNLKMLMLAAFATCVVARVGNIVARDLAAGRISDLPIAQRQALDAIAFQGIAVVDRFT